MTIPALSSTVPVGLLTGYLLMLAFKHVVADFLLQTEWMATGKDRKVGWALPLLAHCAIHGVLTTALLLAVAPRFWFLGPVDFVLHLLIDRAKGFATATFGITPQNQWFWWLIGIDQTLHHLTNFGLALWIAANG